MLASIIWAYENPDKITEFKDKLKIYTPEHEFIEEKNNLNNNEEVFKSNHFELNVTKIASISSKTTFLLNNSIDKKFDINDVSIFTQEGFDLKKNDALKLKINKNFTSDFNGGLKTIFFVNKEIFGLTSSSDRNCYYASIINLSNSNELFKTKCLPDTDIDFNGLGSTTIHKDNEIFQNIKVNTLVMTGENDLGSTVNMSKKLSGVINNSQLKVIKNGKHLCGIECADDVNMTIKNFIEQND